MTPTPRPARSLLLLALLVATVALFGAVVRWGSGLRDAALVTFEDSPAGSLPAYSDAPAAATRFFQQRDSVEITLSRDLTLAEFLALYHLSGNQAARSAVREQTGAEAAGDELPAGTQLVLPLSPQTEAR